MPDSVVVDLLCVVADPKHRGVVEVGDSPVIEDLTQLHVRYTY